MFRQPQLYIYTCPRCSSRIGFISATAVVMCKCGAMMRREDSIETRDLPSLPSPSQAR